MIRRQYGAALVVALWALVFFSILMGGVVATIRLENQQSNIELRRSQVLISSEAGLALAVEKLMASGINMNASGRDYLVKFDNVTLNISVRSERGKLDVNFADITSIQRLLRYLGASPSQAQQLGDQLSQRRLSGQPMRVLEQVQSLRGMDASLYQRLEPNITLWTGLAAPELGLATPDISAALDLPKSTEGHNLGAIVTIRSQAQLDNGFTGGINVTLYLNQDGGGTQLYRVLRWQE